LRFRIVIWVILVLPGPLSAQSEGQSTDALAAERASIIQMLDSLEHRVTEIDQQLSQVSPEEKLEAMISKYGKNKGKLIASGKVWPTISYDMARDSWGEPEGIQKSTLSSGDTQKWSYSDSKYLYFKNGRLESWKE